METGKRLTYLMDALEISGKEMAETLQIDKTIVSKWRKGHRKLAYKSKYMRPVASYLLQHALEQRREVLSQILPEQADCLQVGEQESAIHALSLWLSELPHLSAEEEKKAPNTPMQSLTEVYNGENSWRTAATVFFQEVLQVPTGKTITILDFGQVDWSSDNEVSVSAMVSYMQAMLQSGYHVCIIDKITQDYRSWEVIARWLPVYLSKNVEVRYCQKLDSGFMHQNLFYAPNRSALLCTALENQKQINHCVLSREASTVHFYDAVVQTARQNSRRLFETVDASDAAFILQRIDERLKSGQLTYMMNAMPTFRNMPIALVRAILEDNDVPEDVILRCIAVNEKSFSTRKRCECRQIYNLDHIEWALQQESHVSYELTAIVGKTIHVRREFFVEQLQCLQKHCNEMHYSITLASFSALDIQQQTISLIVQDDSLAVAWDPQRFTRRIFCTELTAVGGFFRYIENLWNRIPPICKNEAWTRKQFRHWIGSDD